MFELGNVCGGFERHIAKHKELIKKNEKKYIEC